METGKDRASSQSVGSLDKLAAKSGPQTGVTASRPGASSANASAALDGVSIEEYARMTALSEAEIWRRLRRGELVGRSLKGRLIIFRSVDAAEDAPEAAPSPVAVGASADLSDLPPLPGPDAKAGATSAGSLQAVEGGASSPEFALLLDHLSLAKEENREILKMTQESIRKVTELSDTIVGMKDAVIEAKESHIAALKEQLDARDREIRRLRQQTEDLEMLTRAMTVKR